MIENNKPKILVVLGPTATGKSDLSIKLAKKFNGEIISADSRQVFRGMNIGTGKITKKEKQNIKHHLLDIISPRTRFNVEKYKKFADLAIEEILKKNKLPIICGGTGFYIQAIVDNINFPEVKPNEKMRTTFEKYSTQKLLDILRKLDSKRYQEIDKNNRVRIIRSIEIARTLGSVPPVNSQEKYNSLQIGVIIPDQELKKRIYIRLIKRLRNGMIQEVKELHSKGVSWKRMEQLGLEYRYLFRFLTDKITRAQMIEQLNNEIWHYARRQKSWFRRDKRIRWFRPTAVQNINKQVTKFLRE